MQSKPYAVYIMANARPTLYVGVTNDLLRRVDEHRREVHPDSFTSRYHLRKLVYYELADNPTGAIVREKQIKNMGRAAKLELIRSVNPEMRDLFGELMGGGNPEEGSRSSRED